MPNKPNATYPIVPKGAIYTTDVRVRCWFDDGTEQMFLMCNAGTRSANGIVTWNRKRIEERAESMCLSHGWGRPTRMRMRLVKVGE